MWYHIDADDPESIPSKIVQARNSGNPLPASKPYNYFPPEPTPATDEALEDVCRSLRDDGHTIVAVIRGALDRRPTVTISEEETQVPHSEEVVMGGIPKVCGKRWVADAMVLYTWAKDKGTSE
jgi:hypothetical protein